MNLDWKNTKIGDEITWRTIISGELSDAAMVSSLADMWDIFWSRIQLLNNDVDWNAINCEYWMDSGRLILFVKHKDNMERIDKGTCEVVIMPFLKQWEKLSAQHPDSGGDFDAALRRYQKQFSKLVIEAAKMSQSFGYLAKKKPVIEFWDADSLCVQSWQP